MQGDAERPRPDRAGVGTAPVAGMQTLVSEEQAAATLDAAWDAGFRYFDTAPHYGLGLAERRLGAALARRPRDEVVVSTKVGRLLVPNPGGEGRLDDDGFAVPAVVRRQFDFSRDGVLRSLEESLERLGLDRVDIVYLHDPDEHWEAASTAGVDALVELRDQGVVGGDRRRDEPVGDAHRVRPAHRHRPRARRRPLHAARAGRARRPAAGGRRARRRRRRRSDLQLGAAQQAAAGRGCDLRLRAGRAPRSGSASSGSPSGARPTASRCRRPRCASRCGTRRSSRPWSVCAARMRWSGRGRSSGGPCPGARRPLGRPRRAGAARPAGGPGR